LEQLEFYFYCLFYKELERIKEKALQQLCSRGWFEEQNRKYEEYFRDTSLDSTTRWIEIGAEHFPQDLKESVFVEVLGLFRTFAREFRQWKAAEYSG